MRKVALSMNEQEKYEIIKNLVEKKGNKRRASTKLNCSLRTIDRLIQKYNLKGKEGFIHSNTGRKPSKTIMMKWRKTKNVSKSNNRNRKYRAN